MFQKDKEIILELKSLRACGSFFEVATQIILEKKSIPVSLKIDEKTFRQLGKCVSFEKNTRSRLSFQCQREPGSQQLVSKVISVGERVQYHYFKCSPEYRDLLAQIKNIKHVHELSSITGLSYGHQLLKSRELQDTRSRRLWNFGSLFSFPGYKFSPISLKAGALFLFFLVNPVSSYGNIAFLNDIPASGGNTVLIPAALDLFAVEKPVFFYGDKNDRGK